MKISRRNVLKSAAMLGASYAGLGGIGRALSSEFKPFMLLCEGINPDTQPSTLFSLLDPIMSYDIPVSCIIDLTNDSGKMIEPGSDLARFLRRLADDYPGLVELIPRAGDLVGETPYFLMRRSGDAQSLLARALFEDDETPIGFSARLAIATDHPAKPVPGLEGVRAAGFQSVLLLPQKKDLPVKFWEVGKGVLQMSGGVLLTSLTKQGEAARGIDRAIEGGYPAIASLSLSELAGHNVQNVFSFGTAIADALLKEIYAGRIRAILPSEFRLHNVRDRSRHLALRIDVTPGIDDDMARSLKSFLTELTQAGVPFSLAGFSTLDTAHKTLAKWGISKDDEIEICATSRQAPGGTAGAVAPLAIDFSKNGDSEESVAIPSCMVVPAGETMDTAKIAEAGVTLITAVSGGLSRTGLDHNGVLNLPAALSFDASLPARNIEEAGEDLVKRIGYQRDGLIVVTPGAIKTAESRHAIVEILRRQVMQGGEIYALKDFRRHVMVEDKKFEQLLSSQAINAVEGQTTKALDAAQKAEFLKDAELAWGFFDKYTDPDTQLIPSTVRISGGARVQYRKCTMWDLGSLIFAVISAHKLGLIDDSEFTKRIDGLLPNLLSSRTRGLRLPATIISYGKSVQAKSGYDVSDIGRLLIALKTLSAYGKLDKQISDLVAQWDLSGAVVNGRLRSIKNGIIIDGFNTNYTQYTARGFSLWQVEALSPYGRVGGAMDMDAKVRLMNKVAKIGSIGTEPHLLEEIELGYSAASRTLADVLYAAQLNEFNRTGKFVCVSEGPLDHKPWFTYQGYKVDGDENPWTIKTLFDSERYRTPGFLRAVAMTNTKGAYLWAAVRPHDYTAKLLAYVREKARIPDLGFSPGVFTATGMNMAGYTDVNTNGIILEAITYALHGQKPFWQAEA